MNSKNSLKLSMNANGIANQSKNKGIWSFAKMEGPIKAINTNTGMLQTPNITNNVVIVFPFSLARGMNFLAAKFKPVAENRIIIAVTDIARLK